MLIIFLTNEIDTIFIITMIFPDDLSIWIDMNREIINSKSYLISFNQKNRSVIQNQSYFNLDTNTSVVSFKNQVRYETSDRIVIANKDSIKVLNKKNVDIIDFAPELSILTNYSFEPKNEVLYSYIELINEDEEINLFFEENGNTIDLQFTYASNPIFTSEYVNTTCFNTPIDMISS